MPPRKPEWQMQEIPFDHGDSTNTFRAGPEKPLVATPAAIEMYSHEVIVDCYRVLQAMAVEHGGLDYLQVFADPDKPEKLWFMEDGEGGAITALLPSDH